MNDYLQKMGITEWKLRSSINSDKYFQVILCNVSGKKSGLILADIDKTADKDLQEALLKKIALALTSNYHIKIISLLSCEFSDEYQVIIFLGDDIIKKMQNAKINCHKITAFSLKKLLQNPDGKKQLWAEIKLLRDIFL